MTNLGLSIIDDTVQTTNAWLNQIGERIGSDKKAAYHVLRAGLHALRDRMTPDEAVHFSQQLPTLIRGLYFENWRPAATPILDRSLDAWLGTLEGHLMAHGDSGIEPRLAAEATFAVLRAHLDEGELRHLETQLPGDVADLMKAA